MTTQTTKIKITNTQKGFILKAIEHLTTLYDFENITKREFKESYGITQEGLILEIRKLKEVLK